MASIGFPFICVKSSSLSDFAVLKNPSIGSILIRKSSYDDPFIKGASYYVSFEDSYISLISTLSDNLFVSSSDLIGGEENDG